MRTRAISEISTPVSNFIRVNIKSVWQLELLLYLRAANCALTPTQIADALYMSPEAMAGGLIHFQSRGLVQPSNTLLGAYKYEPVQREIEAIVEQTAQTYANKRVAIVNLIFSRNAGSMNSSD